MRHAVQQSPLPPRHAGGQFIFRLEQSQIGGDQVQPVKMRLLDRIVERRPLPLAQIGVQGFVLVQIEIGHIAKQSRGRRLAVTIDQEHSIAANGQILGKVHRHG